MTSIYAGEVDGSGGRFRDRVASPASVTVKRLLLAYLVMLHAIPIANMLGLGSILPGTLITLVFSGITIWLSLVYAGSRTENGGPLFTALDGLVGLYAAYCVASFFLYLQPGHPVTPIAFLYGINHLLLPLPLFFAVKLANRRDQQSLLRAICFLNVGMVLIGLVLFYVRPAFYTTFLGSYFEESRNLVTPAVLYIRLNSYVGSTAVGILAAITIALIPRLRLPLGVAPAMVSLMFIAAMLSQQRGGLAASVLAVGYFLVAGRGKATTRALSIAAAVVVVAIMAIGFESRYPGVLAYTADKALSSSSALSERFHSYQVGWNYFLRFPFGLGLGATSSAVYNAGLIVGEEVTDANFARILADLGIAGVVLFAVVVISAYLRAMTKRNALGWMTVLSIYLLVSLGTNVFDIFYVAHLFWVFVGVIDTESPRRVRRGAVASV
jgi:hypothetical protein